ncbi:MULTISPECIES: 3-oxoacyl-ACP reductase FabG [Piscirickettsiaceae]|uniref:3-oxoacyl-ACP reductase FabG n=1 Tax=Hydrogenovibrio thermophilus TaxID=265883 RepID=A0A410H4T3_9GAMM|nr:MULTISPECIES: 3-oxoacyl-ACP reductase FabG [Piscirickettsiaceae]AZR81395.1 3-ketoacyl-ACP reductase [Thiomicrospira sp. S5]AZR81564.1 3-ketoacyl-ACP reductase [Thiomicrospira sp. S5]QAB15929.1 3-oxoacyl-ACP reductase FabG [Hydrogenovibrio thermophilus]
MLTSIQGKTVLITGASKGIGRGIAKVFAKQGANTVIVARHLDAAQAVADELKAAGYEAMGVAADVADKASLQSAVQTAVEAYGGLDILCANAGIFPSASLEEMTEEDWDTVMNTNLKGTLFSVQTCLPELKKSGAGRVVITSSITGPITGFPGWSHYGASKAGQLGFIRTAAIELAKYGITVNAVMPGNILTEGLEDMGDDYLTQMASSIPLKRLGSVEDIANAMLYFASEEAGYVTGQTIVVDGGQVLPESLEAVG